MFLSYLIPCYNELNVFVYNPNIFPCITVSSPLSQHPQPIITWAQATMLAGKGTGMTIALFAVQVVDLFLQSDLMNLMGFFAKLT